MPRQTPAPSPTPAAVTSPSTSATTLPPRAPAPFGFRGFKGHKHDKEAAARRAKTAELLQSMPARIAEARAERRAVGAASPLDALLLRPREIRAKAARGKPQGSPKR